ncbi:MAG: efflux RND transporter periplasmic adaptor subunit [Opitutales bacterium]
MIIHRIALTAIGALLACLFGGCSGEEAPASPPPPTVTVATPLSQEITEYSDYTGRLEAVEQVDVRPRVSGYIDSVHFEEGEKVDAGALLFVIDPRPFEAEVNRRKARVSQAKAALSLAKANLNRANELIQSNAISREEVDIRESESLQAEADVQAAKAELESAELDLSFTRVTAPIAGIADRHLVTPGNLVTGEALNATLLTTIVPHDPIFAYFEIDERAVLRNVRLYMEGQRPGRSDEVEVPALLGLDDEDDFPRRGIIDFAGNQLDADTATLTLRAIFENDDEFLTPGLFARIRVPELQARQALLIPDEAIGSDQALRYVWVVGADNTVERRTIQIGPLHEGLRVVRSGLQVDERIIIKGIQRVRPGATVNPQEGQVGS